MGEARKRGVAAVQEALVALGVETIGGRVQVRWNQREAATPFGQLGVDHFRIRGLGRRSRKRACG